MSPIINPRQVTRRTLLGMGAASTGALLLAACGQAAPTPAPAKPTEPPSTAPVKAADAPKPAEKPASQPAAPAVAGQPEYKPASMGGKTLSLWGLDFVPHKEQWSKALTAFEQKTGVKGKLEPQAWPLETKLVAAMAANTVPDTGSLMGRVLAPLVPPKEQAIEPVDESVFKALNVDLKTWFAPAAIQAYEYDGRHWGVPTEDNQVAAVIAGRPDWIKEDKAEDLWPATKGKDIFESYEAMWDLAKKLQKGDAPNVTRWGLNSAGWIGNSIFGVMKMLGRDWWDTGQKKFFMDSEEGVKALDMIVTIPAQKLKIEGELNQSGLNAFVQGKVALARPAFSILEGAQKGNVPIDIVMAPPAVPGKDPVYVGEGGWGVIMTKQGKNKDAAVEFLKFMTTYEGQRIFSEMYGGDLPGILALRDDELFKGAGKDPIRRWLKYQPKTVYKGSGFGHEPTIEEIIAQVTTELRLGKLTSAEAAKTIQARFTKHFEEFYQKS